MLVPLEKHLVREGFLLDNSRAWTASEIVLPAFTRASSSPP